MSDNLRRYRAIRDALTQWYPGQPSGTVARRLITLAALIGGIVGSKSTQLPHIAAQVPNGTKLESRAKRFARWCDNAHVLEEVYFPYVDVLLRHLALQTVVLVMDGSGVGSSRSCCWCCTFWESFRCRDRLLRCASAAQHDHGEQHRKDHVGDASGEQPGVAHAGRKKTNAGAAVCDLATTTRGEHGYSRARKPSGHRVTHAPGDRVDPRRAEEERLQRIVERQTCRCRTARSAHPDWRARSRLR